MFFEHEDNISFQYCCSHLPNSRSFLNKDRCMHCKALQNCNSTRVLTLNSFHISLTLDCNYKLHCQSRQCLKNLFPIVQTNPSCNGIMSFRTKIYRYIDDLCTSETWYRFNNGCSEEIYTTGKKDRNETYLELNI